MSLELVTWKTELWESGDPVRPDLGVDFKTAAGREVLGLKDENGEWKAFMCYARTKEIPHNVEELADFTCPEGTFLIPYTVWSHKKGAGREIINEVLKMAKRPGSKIKRIVTLSPPTAMAKKFHLRNDAIELRVNAETVNFEYIIQDQDSCSACECNPCDCSWGN